MLILYLDRVEDVEHAKFRALAQILLTANAEDQQPGVDAFDEYLSKAFPGSEGKKNRRHTEMMAALKEWAGLGPIGVTAMPAASTRGKSKMIHRVEEIEKDRGADKAIKRFRRKNG